MDQGMQVEAVDSICVIEDSIWDHRDHHIQVVLDTNNTSMGKCRFVLQFDCTF